MHLHSGIDLRTVQDWLGHVDLVSTMHYLKSVRGKGILERVNARSASAGE
jgi:site-specific recombinase XerD